MCWYCGNPIKDAEPIGRSLRCEDCGKDLRSCANCRHYLPGSRSGCAEAKGEPPADRERGNFCDWYSLNPKFREASGSSGAKEAASSAKTAFDNLFK